MKRNAILFVLLLLLLTPWLVQAQLPAQRVIIVDPTGTHSASVSGGNLGTAGSATVTVETISHITSTTHVAVHTVGGVNVADSTNTALRVNCVTGCSASAGVTGSTHVSVALHVAGTINGAQFHVQGLGIPGQAHGGVLTIQGVAGGVAVPISGTISTDSVNVFHQSTIRHISSVTHVYVVDLPRSAHLATAQSGTWNVNAHIQAGGHLAVTMGSHFSVVIPGHVAITQGAAALQVDCSNCAAAASVTVTHVQSVTHVALVAAFGQHVGAAQSGAWNMSVQALTGHHFAVTMPQHVAITFAGGGHVAITQGAAALQVDCSNCSAASVVNVGHVSGALHLAGTINGAQLHIQGLGIPGQAHGGVLTIQGVTGGLEVAVNCTTGCSSGGTVSHITSVTHVYVVDLPRSAHLAAAQSGAWSVTAHQGGAWTNLTVGHISAMLHVAIVDLPRWAHMAVAQSGTWNVTAHQGGTGYTIQHISTVRHTVLVGTATKAGSGHLMVEMTGPHLTGAIHVSSISNVGSGNSGTGTTAMACHTTVAFSTTADLVLAHSQNSMRIYVCSVVLVAAAAESVSIVEGTGTTCGTGTRGVIGGFGGTMSLAANGGFSSVSPFPWVASSVPGNQVCLDKSGSGNVSGVITYRGSQ